MLALKEVALMKLRIEPPLASYLTLKTLVDSPSPTKMHPRLKGTGSIGGHHLTLMALSSAL